MQITYLGDENFEIKTTAGLISLGFEPKIDGFALPGPGEYEKAGISVVGIPDGSNTIYIIRAEEIVFCYLGKLSRDLPEAEIKEIGAVDILFLPLGKEGTLAAKKALLLLSKIDPRLVIPMLYNDLSEFKTSEGISDGELSSLKIRQTDLPEEERRVVILKEVVKP